MEFVKVINKRHSVRNFKEKKIPHYSKVIKAIESATKAPIAGNLPATKYIMVSDKDKIKELAKAAEQDFLSKAGYIVVICTDKKFLEKYYYERSDRYARQQAGAAIENFLLKITDLGLASCWIGAFSDELVKKLLKIPDDVDVEALLPVGYEMGEETKIKTKKSKEPSLDNVLYFDKYKNKHMKPLKTPEYQPA